MKFKETTKLFYDKYKYKLVLRTPYARSFRERRSASGRLILGSWSNHTFISNEDTFHANKLAEKLKTCEDHKIRVEYNTLSICSNNKENLISLIDLGEQYVHKFYEPKTELAINEIIVKNKPFDYRVSVNITEDFDGGPFVEWSNNNENISMTLHAKKIISKAYPTYRFRTRSYFYVKGENNLLLTKLHLGRGIRRIDRIVKEKQSE